MGWGRPLGIEFIVLVDDEVRASDWEQDLYRMGVPAGVEVRFASVAEAIASLPEWQQDKRRGLLLTADLASMLALRKAHGSVRPINLGGPASSPGPQRAAAVPLPERSRARAVEGGRAGGRDNHGPGCPDGAGRRREGTRIVDLGLSPAVALSLVAWGTIVGVDLVSAPQGLLSRPLVAAAVTGWLLGDVAAGLQVGLVLECFALDVLPVGAAKYPDYGPGAVGATLYAAAREGRSACWGWPPASGSRWRSWVDGRCSGSVTPIPARCSARRLRWLPATGPPSGGCSGRDCCATSAAVRC